MRALLNEKRPLIVKADSRLIAEENRIKVQGRACMTLMPDFFTVEIYNLSDDDLAIVRDSTYLSVAGEKSSVLLYGEIEDIYFRNVEANRVTTICISDGRSFWNATVEKTVASGASIQTAVRNVVDSIPVGSILAQDTALMRGQTFSGRQAEAVRMMAKSMNARAFVAHNTLHIVEKGRTEYQLAIDEDEVITDPKYAQGITVLKTIVRGYPVGIIVIYNGSEYRVAAQSINADNLNGAWDSEILLVSETALDRYGMEGG